MLALILKLSKDSMAKVAVWLAAVQSVPAGLLLCLNSYLLTSFHTVAIMEVPLKFVCSFAAQPTLTH